MNVESGPTAATRERVLERIQSTIKPRLHRVVAEEWGELFLREMDGLQHDRWEQEWIRYQAAIHGDETGEGFYAFLLTHTVCDAQGELLFRGEDVPVLARESGRVLVELGRVAMRINGLGVYGDALVKNFAAGR